MKAKVLVVLAACCLVAAEGPEDRTAMQAVEKAMTALNEAFKNGDAEMVKRLMTADHVAVTSYYGGPQKLEDQLKTLSDNKVTEYKTGKMQVKLLSQDVAMVSYPLTLKATYKGKEVPVRNFVSTVWVRKGNHWLETFYQETPVDGK